MKELDGESLELNTEHLGRDDRGRPRCAKQLEHAATARRQKPLVHAAILNGHRLEAFVARGMLKRSPDSAWGNRKV
jgi:hypothetical protein